MPFPELTLCPTEPYREEQLQRHGIESRFVWVSRNGIGIASRSLSLFVPSLGTLHNFILVTHRHTELNRARVPSIGNIMLGNFCFVFRKKIQFDEKWVSNSSVSPAELFPSLVFTLEDLLSMVNVSLEQPFNKSTFKWGSILKIVLHNFRSLPIDENGEVCGQKIYRWKSLVRWTMIIIPPQSPGFVIFCCLGSVWWTILSCSIDSSHTNKLKTFRAVSADHYFEQPLGSCLHHVHCIVFLSIAFSQFSVHRESQLHISG